MSSKQNNEKKIYQRKKTNPLKREREREREGGRERWELWDGWVGDEKHRDSVITIIGAGAIIIQIRSSQSMEFELFMTNLRQKEIQFKKGTDQTTSVLTSYCWKPFLRYINTTQSGVVVEGASVVREQRGLIGSTCGRSAICGQTAWGLWERQECWSFWHRPTAHTELWLPENYFMFSHMPFFHFVETCSHTPSNKTCWLQLQLFVLCFFFCFVFLEGTAGHRAAWTPEYSSQSVLGSSAANSHLPLKTPSWRPPSCQFH